MLAKVQEDSDDAYSLTDSEEEPAFSHEEVFEADYDRTPVNDSKVHVPCSHWGATGSQGCSSMSGATSSSSMEVLAGSDPSVSLKSETSALKELEVVRRHNKRWLHCLLLCLCMLSHHVQYVWFPQVGLRSPDCLGMLHNEFLCSCFDYPLRRLWISSLNPDLWT